MQRQFLAISVVALGLGVVPSLGFSEPLDLASKLNSSLYGFFEYDSTQSLKEISGN